MTQTPPIAATANGVAATPAPEAAATPDATPANEPAASEPVPAETGGPAGPEPTRYGDWEVKGRAYDF